MVTALALLGRAAPTLCAEQNAEPVPGGYFSSTRPPQLTLAWITPQ